MQIDAARAAVCVNVVPPFYHANATGGITYTVLLNKPGFLKGNRAALVFSAYERKLENQELLMGDIAFRSDVR